MAGSRHQGEQRDHAGAQRNHQALHAGTARKPRFNALQ
jgi:hypothetical protein